MRKVSLLIIGTLVLFSCTEQKQENNAKKDNSFFEGIKTTEVIQEKPKKEISFSGRVICNPDLTVSYSSLVSGVIERSYFTLGDYVNKGQVMLDMRSTELSSLQSELVSLESSLEIAMRELKSSTDLFQDNIYSEREYLENKGKVRQIEASLEKLRADISLYGENKGDGVFSVLAPSNGYVITKNLSTGGSVSAQGDPLFAIADLKEVWVIANIFAGNLQFVEDGMVAEINSIAYPNETFTGKVDWVSHLFDSQDKTIKARITLKNEKIKLKPDMPVVVKLISENETPTISLPSEAIIFDNNSYHTIVENSGNYSIRKVVISGTNSGKSYISSGVESGDRVVVENQLLLYNDLKSRS